MSHRRPPAPLHRHAPDPAGPAGGDPLDALSELRHTLSHAATMSDLERIVPAAARTLAGADGATLALRDGDDCVHAGDAPGSLVWRADRALYDAKRAGRNRLVVAS